MRMPLRGWVLCVAAVVLAHLLVLSFFYKAPQVASGKNALFFEVIGVRVVSEQTGERREEKVEAPKTKRIVLPEKPKGRVHRAIQENAEKKAVSEKPSEPEETSSGALSQAPELASGQEPSAAVAAKPVFAPRPAYPDSARRRGLEGKVKMALLVDEQGHVKDAKLREGSGEPAFDAAALRTVMRWKFIPAKDKNGRALERWCTVLIRFQMNR